MTREQLAKLGELLRRASGALGETAEELGAFLERTAATRNAYGHPAGSDDTLEAGPSELAEVPAYVAALTPQRALEVFVPLIIDAAFEETAAGARFKGSRASLALALAALRDTVRGVRAQVVRLDDDGTGGGSGAQDGPAQRREPPGAESPPAAPHFPSRGGKRAPLTPEVMRLRLLAAVPKVGDKATLAPAAGGNLMAQKAARWLGENLWPDLELGREPWPSPTGARVFVRRVA